MEAKKLKRSTKDRMISGVIGGFSEYFNVDSVLLRVVFVFFLLATGLFPGVIAYLIAILMVPSDAGTVVYDVHEEAHSKE